MEILPPLQPSEPVRRFRSSVARSSIKRRVRLSLRTALTAEQLFAGPFSMARVVLTRGSAVQPDFDNLAWSFKPVLDALLPQDGWRGMLLNDRTSNFDGGRPDYRWERTPRGRGWIRIDFEGVR